MTRPYEAVAIGTSMGGIRALSQILEGLPVNYPLPVLVVQHISADASGGLAGVFNEACAIRVQEAHDKEPIQPGIVYIAPAGYHLLVEQNRTFALSVDPPVNYSRPSIDVLFETAARAYRDKLVGVILTGASRDGSEGLNTIKNWGGTTVVQDPTTAESDIMPRAALDRSEADHVLALANIGPYLGGLEAAK